MTKKQKKNLTIMLKDLKKNNVIHIPVLKKEVIEYLDPQPNTDFIDCTFGGGGHSFSILEKISPKGKVMAIDWTPELAKKVKAERLVLVCGNFADLEKIAKQNNFSKVSGILFDLGMSSWHLEESLKGFSFQKDEPLDMRYSPENPFTARKILNWYSEKDIEKILREYGEERFSKKIARKIVEKRKEKPIETTFQLREIIKMSTPGWYHRRKIHFATKTFQALRIAVNSEIDNLKKALEESLTILKQNGRLVLISFHSLEDRIVKNFLREKAKEGIVSILTKKPIIPSSEEIKLNYRSRSAKLRAAVKI